jgi:carboxymethylenebutenolidase
MTVIDNEFTDIDTATGPMRTYLFRPRAEGRFPGVILFTEIFQVTHQMRRAAAMIAGHGFAVAVPEIFHDHLPGGRVLPYTDDGTQQGRTIKTGKELAAFDGDAEAVMKMFAGYSRSNGKVGTMGFCIGGHLAVRAAALNPVKACAAFYPSGLHNGSLGRDEEADTLERLAAIQGECAFFLGNRDGLIPAAGRALVNERLTGAKVDFSWHELRADHAFMRDAGPTYDPEIARKCYDETIALFRRNLL